jgi:hypothetical protein
MIIGEICGQYNAEKSVEAGLFGIRDRKKLILKNLKYYYEL